MKNKINLTANDSRTSSSRFTAHKNQQKILGKKNPRSRKTKIIHQSPQLRLSNLFALRNKLNSKSFSDGVCVFFSSFFLFILYNIYLFTVVFKICLFILVPVMCNVFPKRGNAIFEIE